MAYTVNAIVACQFEDTHWNYLEEPEYHQAFRDFEDAEFQFNDWCGLWFSELAENEQCDAIAEELAGLFESEFYKNVKSDTEV